MRIDMGEAVNGEPEGTRRAGTVALVGRPNVGKSTLLNRLVGERVSIVTHKPQTTRHRVLGIVTRDDGQAVLVDTPGIHTGSKRAINRYMNRLAVGTLEGVDAAAWVLDATHWTGEDERVLSAIRRYEGPVIAVVNKVDRVKPKEKLLPLLEEVASRHDFQALVPVSARTGEGLDALLEEIFLALPEGEPIYDPELYTNASMRFLAAELVREQLTLRLHQEVPYRLTVETERFEEHEERLAIGAVIWVETPGQKGMVIGRGGQTLKAVGSRAREAMQGLFGRRVHLELWVRVRAEWSDDERSLHALGYREDGP